MWTTEARSALATDFCATLQQGVHGLCFSPYREGQQPGSQISEAQIRERLSILRPHAGWLRSFSCIDGHEQTPRIAHEDLWILQKNWRLLRLYDCSPHAERVLQVIAQDGLPIQVMLGAYLGAEMNNFGCPWGGTFSQAQLEASTRENDAEVGRLIALANRYPGIVFSVAVGNEATVDWTDHRVPVHRMVEHVRRVKAAVRQPVTFCENYVPWQHKLRDLVTELDFISLHTYPLWEYKHIHEALNYTKENVASVAHLYPDKPVVITEAGWCTHSNGRGMHAKHAVQELQHIYYQDLMDWTRAEGLPLTWPCGAGSGQRGGPQHLAGDAGDRPRPHLAGAALMSGQDSGPTQAVSACTVNKAWAGRCRAAERAPSFRLKCSATSLRLSTTTARLPSGLTAAVHSSASRVAAHSTRCAPGCMKRAKWPRAAYELWKCSAARPASASTGALQ